MASAKATTDHDEIRRWVQDRGGFPAHVKATEGEDDSGVLRIDYPGFSGAESLERIGWDQWLEWFDRDNLAFLYQPDGESRFSKLIDRNSVDVTASRARSSSRKTTSKKRASSRRASSKKASSKKSSSKKSSAKRTTSKKASRKSSAKRRPAKRR